MEKKLFVGLKMPTEMYKAYHYARIVSGKTSGEFMEDVLRYYLINKGLLNEKNESIQPNFSAT